MKKMKKMKKQKLDVKAATAITIKSYAISEELFEELLCESDGEDWLVWLTTASLLLRKVIKRVSAESGASFADIKKETDALVEVRRLFKNC